MLSETFSIPPTCFRFNPIPEVPIYINVRAYIYYIGKIRHSIEDRRPSGAQFAHGTCAKLLNTPG